MHTLQLCRGCACVRFVGRVAPVSSSASLDSSAQSGAQGFCLRRLIASRCPKIHSDHAALRPVTTWLSGLYARETFGAGFMST